MKILDDIYKKINAAHVHSVQKRKLMEYARIIEETLKLFGINTHAVEVNIKKGYFQVALEIQRETNVEDILKHEKDLAVALASPTGKIEILAPIPGRMLIGVNIPRISTYNRMLLHDVISQYRKDLEALKLPVVLGTDEQGKVRFADLVDLQHILIQGETGSGKSMFEHTIIYTLNSLLPIPSVKFILADMKCVEFNYTYNSLPNLFCPVILTAADFLYQMRLLLQEKERRLKNVNENYPAIVVIIDGFATCVCYRPLEFEKLMEQIIENSDRTNMHIIMSSSRPSPDLFTPTVKRLFPTRIGFKAWELDDTKVLDISFDTTQLKGKGDMVLYRPISKSILRLQTPYVSEKEINQLVACKIAEAQITL
jgi:S-DNA-T family DNA segregation ATPase FtsK/SpoIIIE